MISLKLSDEKEQVKYWKNKGIEKNYLPLIFLDRKTFKGQSRKGSSKSSNNKSSKRTSKPSSGSQGSNLIWTLVVEFFKLAFFLVSLSLKVLLSVLKAMSKSYK
jgi:hypothetical protein